MRVRLIALMFMTAIGSLGADEPIEQSKPTKKTEPVVEKSAKDKPATDQLPKEKSPPEKSIVEKKVLSPTTTAPEELKATEPSPILETLASTSGPSWWVTADYLMWWTKSSPVNSPFVSTGPESDPFAGSLDRPGTRVLYGNKAIDLGMQSGLRLQAGIWFDDESNWGAELVGMVLQQGGESASFRGGPNGQSFFGLPFVNARNGEQNIYFVAQNFNDPSISAYLTGDLDITTKSQFWAYEANGLVNLFRSNEQFVVGLVGFRSMGLDESIHFSETLRSLIPGGGLTFVGAPVDPSQSVYTFDQFQTTNRFYGPQVGTRFGQIFGGLSLTAHASIAMGVTRQERTTDGSSLLLSGGQPIAAAPGSVYALTSNIGKVSQSDFSVVPELGLSMGYQVTSWMSARFGYNFIYWNNVARATQQVDNTVNPGLVPTDVSYGTPGGPNRPGSTIRTSDFWAQGLNFGIEFRR